MNAARLASASAVLVAALLPAFATAEEPPTLLSAFALPAAAPAEPGPGDGGGAAPAAPSPAASPAEPSYALNLCCVRSLKAPVGYPKSPTEELWLRDFATGQWGGTREEMHRKGLDFALGYFAELFSNVSGGLRKETDDHHVAIVSFDLYPKVGGYLNWDPGAGQQLHITTSWLEGDHLGQAIGTLNPIVNTEAVDGFRLFEAWYGVKWDGGRAEVRLGKILPWVQISAARSACLFSNGSFNYPTFLGFGVRSAYLAAPLGVQLRYVPLPRLTFLVQVSDGYDDPSGGYDNRHGYKIALSSEEGAEAIVEAAWRTNQLKGDAGLPGTYRLGLQYHTAKFADRAENGSGGSLALDGGLPLEHRGNSAVYAVAEQMLFAETDGRAVNAQGLTAFWKGTLLRRDVNDIDWNMAAGLVYQGPIPGRDRDRVGIALSWSRISDALRAYDRDLATRDPAVAVRDAERVLELTYAIDLAPWWTVLLDVQRIGHPGGSSGIRDATVLGVSTRWAF